MWAFCQALENAGDGEQRKHDRTYVGNDEGVFIR